MTPKPPENSTITRLGCFGAFEQLLAKKEHPAYACAALINVHSAENRIKREELPDKKRVLIKLEFTNLLKNL